MFMFFVILERITPAKKTKTSATNINPITIIPIGPISRLKRIYCLKFLGRVNWQESPIITPINDHARKIIDILS